MNVPIRIGVMRVAPPYFPKGNIYEETKTPTPEGMGGLVNH